MKKTTLYNTHIKLGANMVNFSGFFMPIQYSSILEEHMAVRKNVGIFDVSHMGKIFINGIKSLKLIEYINTNNISSMKSGQAKYSCMINKYGGIIDDLIIYQFNKKNFMLIVNASNIKKNLKWINYQNIFNTKIKNYSNKYSILAIQGPKSINTLQPLTNIFLSKIPFFNFKIGNFYGIKNVIISNTGYTGSKGFEIFIKNKYVKLIWNKILKYGKKFNIKPCGLASRDTLRIEMGYCLYGKEINEKISPLESGLEWIVKFNKNFIGKKKLKEQKKNGIKKKLFGFSLQENIIPRYGYELKDENGNKAGIVTSGISSPILKKCIGLGYIKKRFWGKSLYLFIRKKKIPIKITNLPFYKKK
jgi:aminomethyltransferase